MNKQSFFVKIPLANRLYRASLKPKWVLVIGIGQIVGLLFLKSREATPTIQPKLFLESPYLPISIFNAPFLGTFNKTQFGFKLAVHA